MIANSIHMKKAHSFQAVIYKTGINYCVDVPREITMQLEAVKGYISIKGTINGFPFTKSLVPVKNACYRLFVNIPTLKGAHAKHGDTASFVIAQNRDTAQKHYPMPDLLYATLEKENLLQQFNNLSAARKKDVLKYLSQLKTTTTLQNNINKIITQLHKNVTNVRIP